MSKYIFIVLIVFLFACGNAPDTKNTIKAQAAPVDSTQLVSADTLSTDSLTEENADADMATYFVIVADTNPDYAILDKKMYTIHKQFNIPIDTMGRFYNKTKNLIALPDNDEDEIFAGGYYPHRFPSQNLSLEYLNYYIKNTREKTIALVTGIYENENSADSALTALKPSERKVFKLKADIYIGCMH